MTSRMRKDEIVRLKQYRLMSISAESCFRYLQSTGMEANLSNPNAAFFLQPDGSAVKREVTRLLKDYQKSLGYDDNDLITANQVTPI